ncbi:hypothetical protein D3C75_553820 [compost metagenome]
MPGLVGIIFLQTSFQFCIYLRQYVTEGFVKIIQAVAHLVEHRRLPVAELIGLPQRQNLSVKTAAQLLPLPVGQHRIVQLHHLVGDPVVDVQHCLAGSFRRMRRHHQLQRDALQNVLDFFRGNIPDLQLLNDALNGAGLDGLTCGPVIVALAADAVVLLGNVHQLKINGERPDHLVPDHGTQAVNRRHVLLINIRVISKPHGFAHFPDFLNNVQQLFAALTDQYLTQYIGQKADIPPQQIIAGPLGGQYVFRHAPHPVSLNGSTPVCINRSLSDSKLRLVYFITADPNKYRGNGIKNSDLSRKLRFLPIRGNAFHTKIACTIPSVKMIFVFSGWKFVLWW